MGTRLQARKTNAIKEIIALLHLPVTFLPMRSTTDLGTQYTRINHMCVGGIYICMYVVCAYTVHIHFRASEKLSYRKPID